jgi:membrane fusion protein (multidrug efflux system)
LFHIDDRTYRVALEHAEAQLAAARDQVTALKASYRQAAESIRLAQGDESYARTQFDRVDQLAQSGYAAKTSLDQARHALDTASHQVAAARQQQAQILAQLGGDADAAVEQTPAVKSALAARDAAKLDLDRTVVRAPFDGIASQKPDVGRYVAAGQPVMSVVADTGLWVDANFKETQLRGIVAGQPATVEVDAYPGAKWQGTVQSIAQASGAEFSVLPPQNATGNWVKVVQRIPVRIGITPNPNLPPLRVGMSASVSIDTSAKPVAANLAP